MIIPLSNTKKVIRVIMVTGFDKLIRELEDAQEAMAALDGELGTVIFDAHDPASIEAAIQQIETTVDERLGAYASNSIIGPLVDQMKAKCRQGIIDHAAAARLSGDEKQ